MGEKAYLRAEELCGSGQAEQVGAVGYPEVPKAAWDGEDGIPQEEAGLSQSWTSVLQSPQELPWEQPSHVPPPACH